MAKLGRWPPYPLDVRDSEKSCSPKVRHIARAATLSSMPMTVEVVTAFARRELRNVPVVFIVQSLPSQKRCFDGEFLSHRDMIVPPRDWAFVAWVASLPDRHFVCLKSKGRTSVSTPKETAAPWPEGRQIILARRDSSIDKSAIFVHNTHNIALAMCLPATSRLALIPTFTVASGFKSVNATHQ
jgi:hypothetical protein